MPKHQTLYNFKPCATDEEMSRTRAGTWTCERRVIAANTPNSKEETEHEQQSLCKSGCAQAIYISLEQFSSRKGNILAHPLNGKIVLLIPKQC